MNVLVDQHSGGCCAVLAGVEETSDSDSLSSKLKVSIVEDDNRRLATKLQVDALEVTGCSLGHLHTCTNRTGDGDHLGNLVVDHRCATGAVTSDDVNNTGWQVESADFSEQQRALRSGVGGLQHRGVTSGNSRGELPDRHVQRIVPRSDLTDNTDRLTPNHRGVIFHVFTGGTALEVSGSACEESNLVNTDKNLVLHERAPRLPGVLRLKVGKIFSALLHLIRDTEQSELTLGGRGLLPGLECGGRCLICAIDICLVGDRRVGVHLLRGWVDQLEGILALGVDIGTVDKVFQSASSHAHNLTQRQPVGLAGKIVCFSLLFSKLLSFSVAKWQK